MQPQKNFVKEINKICKRNKIILKSQLVIKMKYMSATIGNIAYTEEQLWL